MTIATSIKHGLFWHQVLARLKRSGITIHPYYLVREGMGDLENEKLTLPAGFIVEQLRRDDIAALQSLIRWATPEEVERRLNLGHLCLVLRCGNDIAGYTWADPHRVNDSVCPYQLASGEAYLYDAYVVEQYRGGGLASKMRFASYVALRASGMRSFVSLSTYFNTGSIKFKRRLGAQPVNLYLHLQLFSLNLGHWTIRSYAGAHWHPE